MSGGVARPARARRASAGAVTLVAAAAMFGCGGRTSGGDRYAAAVQRAIPGVEKGVGLRFRTPPRYEARSRAQVREFVERQFAESDAARDLAGRATAYKRLGLLPDTLDVQKLYTRLLTEQIVGFYDPKTKTFYFIGDSPPEAVGLVASHELVHALQDQYLNLDSLDRSGADDDRLAAAHALLEGQATINMVGGDNFAAMVGQGWDRIRDAIRDQRTAAPVFSSAPQVIQEELLFPYLNGAEFMRRARDRAPNRNLLIDVPASTEQILHADAYFGARDAPTRVTLPAIVGAKGGFENTLGEFGTRLFLFQHSKDAGGAAQAAAGWDGDRYAVVATPAGDALVWASVWDTGVDAAQFVDAATQAAAVRYDATPSPESVGGSRVIRAGGRRVTIAAGDVGGRPVVVYTDSPDAAPVVADPARVVLAERPR